MMPQRHAHRGTIVPESLNEKQEQYCINFIDNGGNGKKAAEDAGFSSPYDAHSRLSRHPLCIQRIRELQTRIIGGELATKAINTLRDIMESPANPPAARVSAAKIVLEMAGHGIVAQGLRLRHGLETDKKDLSEMTQAELEQFVSAQKALIQGLEEVNRSNAAPLIELNASESTVSTALLGQLTDNERAAQRIAAIIDPPAR